ncbi:MAG TPA: DUF3267 domain-containing protein [Balneolaceae bacterium]
MKKNEYTLNFAQANGYALGLIIPIFAAYLLPYGLLYGWETMWSDFIVFFTDIPLFLISLIAGTIIHELLHAVCWSWLDRIPWSKIHFGFKWRTITPYVHCPEPIEVSNYRWGVAMPGIFLGVLPFLAALILQNGWLLGFGLFFTLAAGGDILILWLLRKVDEGLLVQDHPDLVGCIVLERDLT